MSKIIDHFQVVVHMSQTAQEILKFALFFFLFDLILYIPVNNFSFMSGRSSLVEPVLSKDKCVLLKDTAQ